MSDASSSAIKPQSNVPAAVIKYYEYDNLSHDSLRETEIVDNI